MSFVALCYLAFAICGTIIFIWLEPRVAMLAVVFSGWIFLPIAKYPVLPTDHQFPYWIIGLALPSDIFLSKALVINLTALLGVLMFDRISFQRWSWSWWDAVAGAWSVMPFWVWISGRTVDPPLIVGILYQFSIWGVAWVLGRLYLTNSLGRIELLQWLVLSLIVCLPFAILEGIVGPFIYDSIYPGGHPFRLDGHIRYVGYRPILHFEHGNQYGIWVGVVAMVAFWLAKSGQRPLPLLPTYWSTKWSKFVSIVCAGLLFASQSVGAIGLAVFGVGVMFLPSYFRIRSLAVGMLLCCILTAIFLTLNATSLRRFGTQSVIGKQSISYFRSVGRGSLPWRVSQDLKSMELIKRNPWIGDGRWDWWRENQTRPWGLSMLILGQFGVLGVILCSITLLGTSMTMLWRMPMESIWTTHGVEFVYVVVVCMVALDACMNAFLFHPAIMMSASLVGTRVRTRGVKPTA